jgi:hypothetical protein
MVVVGGYIGQDISCEFPGVYVFNTSSLEWVNSFTSLTANEPKNPFSQQENQIGVGIRAGIEGSYDYAIPEIVYDTIGGDSTGGATYAGPVVTATAGPMATGKPIVYTITASSGAPTGIPTSLNAPQHTSAGTNIGATVAGVIAGVLFLLACYLAFCAYLYRKQLQLYKRHVALQQEQGHTVPYTEPVIAGFFGGVKRGSWKETTEGSRSSASGVVSPLPNGNNNRVSDAVGGTLRPYSPGSGGSQANSREDLMEGMEPNYWGVLLHPRRSLRVINR